MESQESIYFNWGETSLVADFPVSLSSLLIDTQTYGLAMKETFDALGIHQYHASAQTILFGGVHRALDRLPSLASKAKTIAKKASYEQASYSPKDRDHIRDAVEDILSGLEETLPEPAMWNDAAGICAQVVLGFAKAVLPKDRGVEIVYGAPAPKHITPEAIIDDNVSAADRAECYLQVVRS